VTVEMTEPEELPSLRVSVNIPEPEYDHLNGFVDQEITIEATLDGEVVVIVAFPHDDKRVDRPTVHQTLALVGQSIDQILDQMEAQSE
jgi:hypothetical protein